MKVFLVPFFCLSCLAMVAQQSAGIEYSPTGTFHWGMFKGKVNPKHVAQMGKNTGAVTVSSLSYQTLEITGKTAKIKITAQFHPTESWSRYPDLHKPNHALNHEKRHFDICEIYARKIRQIVSNTRFSRKTFNDELDYLFQKLATEHRSQQAVYDKETEHSIDEDDQHIWNASIDAQLKELAEYSDTIVTVTLN